ncbi:MAG: 2'-5' RNA ligase family protein [Lachnospiraceae bacterium]|nr:2'-5' RNA ligase family protein [Lachnospiraceae bacterium]
MYLISIYFDESTNKKLKQYIHQIAKITGNTYMLDYNVPPHITISSFFSDKEEPVISMLEKQAEKLKQGYLQWVSVGMFLPNVIYLMPVLNEYLHTMSVGIYNHLMKLDNVEISRCYRPFQWIPHTTVGKKLSKEEMAAAFQIIQNQFGVFDGKVTHIGLAKTNPYQEIVLFELDS